MSARLSVEVRRHRGGPSPGRAKLAPPVLLCFPPKVKADSWLASDYVAILQSNLVSQVNGVGAGLLLIT